MKENYLLGATKDHELVFGKFVVTKRNGHNEFSASFYTVRPFNGENFDFEDYYEGYIEGLDKAYLYDMCEQFDCAPSALVENLADECDDPRDALDCSLYPKEINVDSESWYFESCSCGQHDTRNEMEEIINFKAYNLLHELWDKYHSEKIDDSVVDQVENLVEMFEATDNEGEWIVSYIKRHMDDFE